MSMTITEKISAFHEDLKRVEPEDLVNARIDIAMGNDITVRLAIEEMEKIGFDRVFKRTKMVLIPDHFVPNKGIRSAKNCKKMNEFAKRREIIWYYEVGEMGIEHALLPDKGDCFVWRCSGGRGNSHNCTCSGNGAFATGVGSTNLPPQC